MRARNRRQRLARQQESITTQERRVGTQLSVQAEHCQQWMQMTQIGLDDECRPLPFSQYVMHDWECVHSRWAVIAVMVWFVTKKVMNRTVHARNGNMPRQRTAFTQEAIQRMLEDEKQQTGLDKAPNPEITFFDENEELEEATNKVHVIWFPMLGRLRECEYEHGTTMQAALADLARQMKVARSRLRCNLMGLDIDGELPHVKRVVIHLFVGPPDPHRTRRPRRRPSPKPESESEQKVP